MDYLNVRMNCDKLKREGYQIIPNVLTSIEINDYRLDFAKWLESNTSIER